MRAERCNGLASAGVARIGGKLISQPPRALLWLALLLAGARVADAAAALFLEEPYGAFGRVNPTGHAAVYLSGVCAASPVLLRRCEPGETGVVISRYHRVGGYDWIAIPLIPYLYAVEGLEQVPLYLPYAQDLIRRLWHEAGDRLGTLRILR